VLGHCLATDTRISSSQQEELVVQFCIVPWFDTKNAAHGCLVARTIRWWRRHGHFVLSPGLLHRSWNRPPVCDTARL